MARKSKKELELSSYELIYDSTNLFDDEYGDIQRQESLILDEIQALQNKNINDNLKLGRNMLELLNGDISCSNFDRILKTSNIHVGRTQAIKYIECFNCFNQIYRDKKSTEQLEEIGIEKTYLLTTLKKSTYKYKLIDFIISENLTVKELTQLIKVINDDSPILKLYKKFYETLDESEIAGDLQNPF